ncbi:MAG: peptide/nickel transport system substrate-binding protein [Mycobacterium sp.]|jgi:peptide/nickel transport system substrate-binding protein|nr:peptide/nickel transport system substrate-binding protein [Mycobacterium sp.]
MKIQGRRWALAAVTAALVVAGCSPGDKSEPGDSAPPKPADSITRIKDKGVTAKGGTVYVLNSADFASLDPVNNYMTDSSEVGRLMNRTLTFVKDTPGEDLSVQPDLAESLGDSSDGGKTWTYKLREGLKYEDGKPITAADVKYGVQRSFAQDVYDMGATYMVDLLANETDYAGPYATPEKDLTSVETPDDRTLVFHFKGPQADADWMLSQMYTAPVPKAADIKQAYADRPLASGPYKIEKYTRDESLVLVRNDQWDPATDPNRPAYPDRFEFSVGTGGDATKRLLASKGDDAYAVTLNTSLLEAPKLDDPSVDARFINGPGPCVDYLAMNTQKITDPDVRHAVALAADRLSIQQAYGGDLFGTIADSINPPTVVGFSAPDLGLKPQGDAEAAKKLLAGKAVPPLRLAITAEGRLFKVTSGLLKKNLNAVGIDVTIDEYKTDDEYAAAIEGDDPPGLSFEGWCADWPTPATVVPAVFGPDPDGKTYGSSNITRYYDPATAKEMQDLLSSTEPASAVTTKLIDLGNKIQTSAWPLLPTILNNTPEVVGANLTNAGISPLFGVFDLNTVAVKK